LLTIAAYAAGAAAYADHSRYRAPLSHLHERFVELAGSTGWIETFARKP
jgi:hypothetical protein